MYPGPTLALGGGQCNGYCVTMSCGVLYPKYGASIFGILCARVFGEVFVVTVVSVVDSGIKKEWSSLSSTFIHWNPRVLTICFYNKKYACYGHRKFGNKFPATVSKEIRHFLSSGALDKG